MARRRQPHPSEHITEHILVRLGEEERQQSLQASHLRHVEEQTRYAGCSQCDEHLAEERSPYIATQGILFDVDQDQAKPWWSGEGYSD